MSRGSRGEVEGDEEKRQLLASLTATSAEPKERIVQAKALLTVGGGWVVGDRVLGHDGKASATTDQHLRHRRHLAATSSWRL